MELLITDVLGESHFPKWSIRESLRTDEDLGERLPLVMTSCITYWADQDKGTSLIFLSDSFSGLHRSWRLSRLKVAKECRVVAQKELLFSCIFQSMRLVYLILRIIRLSDQKIPAMDKLYFYVHQADANLLKWLDKLDSFSSSWRRPSSSRS